MWESQFGAFDDAVAPPLYGRGRSLDEWAASLLGELDGPFVACGASMGGYCALALARRAPERLRGLVLAGARVDADSAERRAGRERTIELIREGGTEALWEDMRPKVFSESAPAGTVERARTLALEQDAELLVQAVEAMRDRTDSSELVAGLDVPLIVAVGEHDPFLPLEEARAIGGSVHVFHGAGHLPSLERPEEFKRLVAELV